MTDEEKVYQAYYQPDRLWTGNKAMKPKDAIKLDNVPLDKKYPEETVLPEDGLYRYLYQPGEQHGDQKRQATDLIWSKNTYRLY